MVRAVWKLLVGPPVAPWREECGMKKLSIASVTSPRGTRDLLEDIRGQGTTEYAILVGVLVVIAIIAIVAFRGKVQELWNAIVDGMNSL